MKPSRVKAAAEAADAQIKAMKEAQSEAPAATDNLAGTDESDAPSAPAVDLKVVADSTDPSPQDKSAESIDTQLQALRSDLELMTTRWKSQEGVIRSQAQQIEQYQQLLANMPVNQPADQPSSQPAAQSAPAQPTWSQTEEDAFGADLVEFIHKVSRQEAAAAVSGIAKQMEGLQGTVENTSSQVAVSANDLFERKLDELAPGWEKLDRDPKFLAWLKERPVFGNAIAAGAQQLDYKACAEIFNTYKDLQTATSGGGEPAPKTVADDLQAQVVPGKGRSTAPESRVEPQEKIWGLSEIQAVYKNRQDRSQKVYTDAEFAKLEREIATAQREQRVDYSR